MWGSFVVARNSFNTHKGSKHLPEQLAYHQIPRGTKPNPPKQKWDISLEIQECGGKLGKPEVQVYNLYYSYIHHI